MYKNSLFKHTDSIALKADKLSCHFSIKTGFFKKTLFQAVKDFSFEVRKGEVLGIVGESGCGKSTVAKMLTKMIIPSSGKIFLTDTRVDDLSLEAWRPLRKQIQMVFQDPLSSLNPVMAILDQVIEPLTIHKIGTRKTRHDKAGEFLQRIGIGRHLFNSPPTLLSGGQRQRVVLARALIIDPDVLVCDEPVSALDVSIQAQIIVLLKELVKERNLAVIFISHDLEIVRHICHRIIIMYMGEIVEETNSAGFLENPRHPYTRCLASSIPKLRKNGFSTPRILLKGEPQNITDSRPTGCIFYKRCHEAMEICEKEPVPTVVFECKSSVKCHRYS